MDYFIIIETDDGNTAVTCPEGDDPITVAEQNHGTLVDSGPFSSYEEAIDAINNLQLDDEE